MAEFGISNALIANPQKKRDYGSLDESASRFRLRNYFLGQTRER